MLNTHKQKNVDNQRRIPKHAADTACFLRTARYSNNIIFHKKSKIQIIIIKIHHVLITHIYNISVRPKHREIIFYSSRNQLGNISFQMIGKDNLV